MAKKIVLDKEEIEDEEVDEEIEEEEEPKGKKDIVCRSCGNEFLSKKVKVTKPCPYCKQASLEKKI